MSRAIDLSTWLLLARRLREIREAREAETVTLVFDEHDQARVA